MNEGDRALVARRDDALRRLRHHAHRRRLVQRTGRERPTLKPITFLCAFRHDVRCPHGNFPQVRLYPARKSARAKLSPRRYGSSRCQRLHYAARRQASRWRRALAEGLKCLLCGNPMAPEFRRGPKRKYHPQCAVAAANARKRQRRTPEETLAGKERAVHTAQILLALARKPEMVAFRRQRLHAAVEELAAFKATLATRNARQRRRRAKERRAVAETALKEFGLDRTANQERARHDPEYRQWAKERDLL